MAVKHAPSPVSHRRCPVCGGSVREQLFHQEFQTVAGAALMDGYDVVVCLDCGCGFADRIPEQAVFDAYYRDLSKYEYHQRAGEVSASDRARFEATAAMLQPHLSPGDRILDIGCATGALLAELRKRGFAQVTGLDPSPVCAASARRVYDIPVLVGTLAEVAIEEPFDLVILVGVLEHVRDLAPMLAQVGPLLRPGGLAFVEVPDALQFTDWRNAPFQQFSVEHINFFSPTSLENAMNCNGFDTVAVYQDVREVGHRAKDPVASGVFRRREHQEAGDWRKDPTTAPALRNYIEQCRGSEAQERRKIDELVASGEPLIVWGTGTQTQRLLATGNLGKTNLRAFVDSNVKYQGKTLHDLPILGPEELKGRSETVLISSWMYQEEIHQQLRDTLGLPNKVVLIYAR